MNLCKWGIMLLSCIIVFVVLVYFKVIEICVVIVFGELFFEYLELVEEVVV